MKKRSLSILMIVCMLFSMMPSLSFASESNETKTEPHVHCVCGRTDCGTENGHNQNQVWTAWNGIDPIPDAEYIYLSDNVESTGVRYMEDKSLCLNGKVYKKSGSNKHCAFTATSGNMTITDCDNETLHRFKVEESGLWVLDEVNGDKVVTGGVITGFTESALCVYNYNLKLYGGNIVGNTKTADGSGGGAAVWIRDCQFDMYGGTIQGNYINGSSSGVYITCRNKSSSFNMHGGAIQENYATSSGGGVYISDGQFNMYGGSIERNHAGSYGGGVYADTETEVCMYDGSISNNTANYAGGVDFWGNSFEMKGGHIDGNENTGTSETPVGGVGISSYSSFSMSGGTIDNNVGFGLAIYKECTLEGDISISGNKYVDKNSNIYLSSNKKITIGTNGLSNTKRIGVTTKAQPNDNYSVNITNLFDGDYSDNFTSDNKIYSIAPVQDPSTGKYKVVLTNTASDGIITYDEPTNGTFTVKVEGQPVNSNTEVSENYTVTIEQVVPNPGYVIDTVKYNDTVIEKGEGDKYTFKMPEATDVTISVTFKAIEYPVWVGGEQFTSEKLTISGNDGDAATDDGTATLTVGGTVDAPIYTLTLTNFTYSGEGGIAVDDFYDYYAAIFSKDSNLNIVLVGENKIFCTTNLNMTNVFGIYTTNGILTISSKDESEKGKLKVHGETCGILSGYTNVENYGLVIKNAVINASSDSFGGIVTGNDIVDGGDGSDIFIESSDVTTDRIDAWYGGSIGISNAKVNSQYGLSAVDMIIHKSEVTSEGSIYISNRIEITNESIVNITSEDDYGINIDNSYGEEPCVLSASDGNFIIKGNSTVTSTGATGAFNTAPTLEGEFKVFAGDDETADEVDSITDNFDKKYVKIMPVPTVIAPNAIDNLVYNANDQALISAGSTTVGTLQYALGTDSTTAPTTGWAETIPTAKYAGKYYVWYKVDGSENYAGIEPTFATEVTIGQATPECIVPTGLTATYGQTLANVTLPADWAWKDAATSVGNAGTNTFTAVFTPADTDNYNTVEVSVSVTVAKANPTYTVPTDLTATYGDTLADVTLPAGWVWKDATTTKVGNAGEHTFIAIFTPNDTNNYETVEVDVTVKVNKFKVNKPTADSTVYTYNGNVQTYVVVANGNYTVTGNTRTDAGSQTVTVALKDKANTEWADSTSDDVTFTFTIGKATPNIGTVSVSGTVKDTTAPENVVLLHTGSATGTFVITDSVMLADKNEYNWKFTPADTLNYKTVTGTVAIDVLDTVAPTASITVAENVWKKALNNITFGIFFKDTQIVTITFTDNEHGSDVKAVEYYVSDAAVTDFISVQWTKYKEAFSINPDYKFVIYARVTDNDGNSITVNSDGIIVDATKPVVENITNNGVYYGDLEITVTDELAGVNALKVDGTLVTMKDGKYTITADNAQHTVIVTDNAGNEMSYAITVYKNYTVTYKADGKVVATKTVGHGLKLDLTVEIPVKVGYEETKPYWAIDGVKVTEETAITKDGVVVEAVYTKNPAGKYTNTTPETNEGGAVLDNTMDELKESVPFTEGEMVKIEQGDDVKLWLEVTDISDTIPTEEKVLVEEKMNDRTLGMYLDVDMFKQIGADDPVAVTQFNSAIKVSFVLDDTLINTDNNVLRVYSVIRVHNGVADEIECEFDAETKTLSFETDRLSTYVVVCKDTLINTDDDSTPSTPPVNDVPSTGDTTTFVLWLVLMLIGIATIVVGKRYKEMK